MPNERRFAHDPTYSEWHRPKSISRFIPMDEAESLAYIDADWIEVCPACWKTLLLVEAALDTGNHKSTRILEELARDASKQAAVVFYQLDPTQTFTTNQGTFKDIVSFRVRRVWPSPPLEHVYTPKAWALALLKLREKHHDECSARTPEVSSTQTAATSFYESLSESDRALLDRIGDEVFDGTLPVAGKGAYS